MDNNFDQQWNDLFKQEKELLAQWDQSIERENVLMSKWANTEFGTEEMSVILDQLTNEAEIVKDIMIKMKKIDEQQFALLEKERDSDSV